MTCAGIHRECNQKIKGVGHSTFTAEDAMIVSATDNDQINALYLAGYNATNERMRPPADNMNQQHLRTWIKSKYVDKVWYKNNGGSGTHAGGGAQQPQQRGTTNQQQQQQQSSYGQPTVVQIPPKQEQDLFGGFSSSPQPTAPQPLNANDPWDAFGGSSSNKSEAFPADFGSSQARQQFQQPPQQQQQHQFNGGHVDATPQPDAFANFNQQDQQQPAGFINAYQQQGGFANVSNNQQLFHQLPSQQQPMPQGNHQQQLPSLQNQGMPFPQQMQQMQPPPNQQQMQQLPNQQQISPQMQQMPHLPNQQQMQQPPSQQQIPELTTRVPFPQQMQQMPQQNQQQMHQPNQQQMQQPNKQEIAESTKRVPFPHQMQQMHQQNQQLMDQQNQVQPSPPKNLMPFPQQMQQMPSTSQEVPSTSHMQMRDPQQSSGFASFSQQQFSLPAQLPQQQMQLSVGFANFDEQGTHNMPTNASPNASPSTAADPFTSQVEQLSQLQYSGVSQVPLVASKVNARLEDPFASISLPEQSQPAPKLPVIQQASSNDMSVALSKMSVLENVKTISKYATGQKVYYKSSSYVGEAKILKVHLDDQLQPFYTISVDGKEKQTDDSHISVKGPLYEAIESSLAFFSDVQLKQVLQYVNQLKGAQVQLQSAPTIASPFDSLAQMPQTPSQNSMLGEAGSPRIQPASPRLSTLSNFSASGTDVAEVSECLQPNGGMPSPSQLSSMPSPSSMQPSNLYGMTPPLELQQPQLMGMPQEHSVGIQYPMGASQQQMP
jgi:hypothetical protein